MTVETVNKLEQAKDSSSKDSRIVLSAFAPLSLFRVSSNGTYLTMYVSAAGRAGCGKSFLLHQAVQYAKSQGWIVLYIPRGTSLSLSPLILFSSFLLLFLRQTLTEINSQIPHKLYNTPHLRPPHPNLPPTLRLPPPHPKTLDRKLRGSFPTHVVCALFSRWGRR